ncbi:DUF5977 domain-containing protein [Flavobacterium sp. 1355]|uniref:DUF5977 domain-containing protein n=1 Tax=Flavobacterium sp. 1355 TaxID=2806571 RepID=UPI001AE41994|nr:DUF5977 domain-containing protein [Flavobacterium sp. 1355]MBP1221902.1 hypothetical protein [Flavobacterium sp. 1355]
MKINYFKATINILFICCALLATTIVVSQETIFSRLNIKSPGVTDFIRYGNIQSSSYTGTIDLKIPLLSFQNSNQSPMDISLIYNSSGFTPTKRSGIVGLNWALNMGGVITRRIKGVPDDYVGYLNELNPSVTGVYATNGFIVGQRKNQTFPMDDIFNFSSNTGFLHGSNMWMLGTAGSANAYEASPDLFEFNFNGISGKFHMGNDGKIKVVTNQPNNLIVDVTGFAQQNGTSCAPIPSEIKITDNQGNQYFFGGSLNNLEYTLSLGDRYTRFVGIPPKPIITSWFLRKIIYANNSQLVFTNRVDTLIPDDLGDGPTSNIVSNRDFLALNQYIFQQKNFSERNIKFFGQNIKDYSNSATTGVRSSYELQKKVILDKIEGDNFIVNFKYSPQKSKFNRILPAPSLFEYEEIKLDNIKLTDKSSNLIKSIDFSYDYLGGQYDRMFLVQLTETGKSPYKFEYNVTDNLPDPSSRGVDYWGFWNGLDAQTTLIPEINYTISEDFTYTSNTREPSFAKSKQGLLAKINYPTGGYTKFEYEPNYFSQLLERPSSNKFLPILTQKNGTGGGARIFKITDFDGNTDTNIRKFSYIKNYSPSTTSNTVSSGILMQWPRYATHYDSNTSTENTSTIHIQSNSVTNNTDDNVITYSEVVETNEGTGYVVNKFKDYSTTPDLDVYNKIIYFGNQVYGAESNITPLELFKNDPGVLLDDRSWERGKLLSRKLYDKPDNLIEEETYTYNNVADRFNRYSVSMHQTGLYFQANRQYYYNDYLTQKIRVSYINNIAVISSTERYEYGTGTLSDNLIMQSNIKSQTGTLVSKNFYPHDPLMAAEPYNAQLIAKNIIGMPLKTESFNDNTKVAESITKYGSYGSTVAGQPLYLPQYVYTKKGNVVPDQLERKVTYDKYDTWGNISQYTTEYGKPVSVIWGYNKTLPVAKIENATNSQLQAFMGVTDINSLNESDLASISAVRTNNAAINCMVTSYTHKPMIGISSITDPKGITTYYEYDSNGRLMFVKDHNLNILQRYCYGYKGQVVDCAADNPYAEVFKSIARSGSFTKNNCASGAVGSSVAYSQPAGAATSTVSQADADAKGLSLFNAQGQANANTTGTCVYNSIARSGSFTRNNCVTATGSSVTYSQPAGAQTSTVSQADADAKGLALFNTKGQANANASGTCTYSSPAESGSFRKGGCPSGSVGSTVVYSQAAGAITSTVSQADADNRGHQKFLSAGGQYATLTGTCLYNSIAYSGTFYRNNCAEGQYGSGVAYSQPAGASTGTSQSAADEAGLAKFNADGQANANLTGSCTQMITYQYAWNQSITTLLIVAKAVSNPTGYTLRFNVTFADGYNLDPQIVEISMAAGELSKSATFKLPAPAQSVQLVTIWKN